MQADTNITRDLHLRICGWASHELSNMADAVEARDSFVAMTKIARGLARIWNLGRWLIVLTESTGYIAELVLATPTLATILESTLLKLLDDMDSKWTLDYAFRG